jgi:hypothetical protein
MRVGWASDRFHATITNYSYFGAVNLSPGTRDI